MTPVLREQIAPTLNKAASKAELTAPWMQPSTVRTPWHDGKTQCDEECAGGWGRFHKTVRRRGWGVSVEATKFLDTYPSRPGFVTPCLGREDTRGSAGEGNEN